MTHWLDRLSRLTVVPVLLRGIVFLAAWAGLWLAAPETATAPRYLLILAGVGLAPALLPGTRVVDAVMLGIVGLWVASTLGFGEAAHPVRTFATGAALYLTHSAAALAATLPYDAVVDGQVLRRWAGRCALVLAASGGLTAVVVALAAPLSGVASTTALFVGLLVTVGLVAVLVSQARRKRH